MPVWPNLGLLISTVDALAQEKFLEFTRYKHLMFMATASITSLWAIIKGHDKAKARMEAMRYILHTMD